MQTLSAIHPADKPQSTTLPPDPAPDNPAAGTDMDGLLTFLPLLYVGWADAVLTPSRLDLIRQRMAEQAWLSADEQARLQRWTDPANPPSPAQMKGWLATIRAAAADLPPDERLSLAELGVLVARREAPDEYARCANPAVCAALDELEEALGVIGPDAATFILSDERRPQPPAPVEHPSFPVDAMTRLLEGEHAAIRRRMWAILSDPVFQRRIITDKEAYRTQVLAWTKLLAEQGMGALAYPPEAGGAGDITQYLAAFGTLAHHDLSLAIKFGVQFGLFGGSIQMLGTAPHHERYLPDIGTLALPGCFAMTETDHGSNVREIETTARYDPDAQEFAIHTPHPGARKDYIGNAARDGRMATVFAQLFVGDDCHGVHAFVVPIRDEAGRPMPGVRIEDVGEKLGLNGVDNGRLYFDQVRVPRTALLNRFGDVTPAGEYVSDIASESRRFFTMLGTLVGGRVGIATAALSGAKSALTIAIRYATRRRQFGPPGEAETLLLDYRTHQRRLLIPLANVYALDFALKYLTRRFARRTEEDAREVEALAAGIKSVSTWNTIRTAQECREACGAQGYLAENRFAAIKADTDIFATFEGDNTVLMQLVAKACLSEFQQQFHDMNIFGLARFIAGQATHHLADRNSPSRGKTDAEHLRDPGFQLDAFRHREEALLSSAAARLKKRIDRGMDSYAAMLEVQTHLVVTAQAFVERVILEQFMAGVDGVEDAALAETLKRLVDLYALSTMEKHGGWYLEHGLFEGAKTKAIRREVDRLCLELRPDARGLVDAFAIPDPVLAAPIGI